MLRDSSTTDKLVQNL